MDAKSSTFISTFILILISLIGGIVTQDNCGFGFCNWIQRTSDVTFGASFSRTTGQQSGRTKKTTDRPSGHTNKTTDPQSGRRNKTTDPQSGSTNKTTDRPSGRTNKTTDLQSGSTNKTTDPQSGLTNTLTGQQSGRTNKTTDPQSGRTNETAEPQSGSTNKTTDQPSGRTNTKTGQQSIRTNKTTDPQSGHTNKTTDPPSGRPNKTTNTQSGCTNKTTETPSGLTNKTTGPRNSRNNKTEDPQSASFVNCSFKDGMCDLESIFAVWKIGQGSPTTSGTESAHDHTLRNVRGIYIYLDPKSVNTSQSQELESSPLPCLYMWYHICGKDTGNLTVSIETKETTMATKVSTTQSGNKIILGSQEEKFYDKWHRVEITIETQEDFRVLLVGTTKRQNGAIAVDDIQLSKCCCRDSCGLGFWNWFSRITDDCTRTFETLLPGTTSPQSGCTNNSPGPQSDGTNATSTTRDLKESTYSVGWDEAFTNTTRPAESNFTESYTNGAGHQITTKGHIPKVTVEVITVSLVGTVMFVIFSLLVGVWTCRTKRCSKQRNTGNASIQLPSYETLQHGINIGDYVNVVYSPIQSITECPSIPFPHNITSNNDNEYDYVS